MSNHSIDLSAMYMCKLCARERSILGFVEENTERPCRLCHKRMDEVLEVLEFYQYNGGVEPFLTLIFKNLDDGEDYEDLTMSE